MTDPAPGERRPVAMTPYAIAVALFAAFVVGGILAKVVPLWVVVLVGLVVGAAVFVLVDRYSRLPGPYDGLVAPDPGSCTAKFVGCTAGPRSFFLLRPC